MGDSVIISLPTGFKFQDGTIPPNNMTAVMWGVSGNVAATYDWYGADATMGAESASAIRVPANMAGTPNPLYVGGVAPAALGVTYLADNEIQVSTTVTNLSDPAYFYVNLGQIFVKDGFEGDINVTFTAPSGSGFPSGSIVVGTVAPAGQVEVAVVDTSTFDNEGWMMIRIKEATVGSLEAAADTLKFALPDGFEWKTIAAGDIGAGNKLASFARGVNDAGEGGLAPGDRLAIRSIWGDPTTAPGFSTALNAAGDKLSLNTVAATTAASYYEIYAKFAVTDETKAELGSVKVTVSGESNVSTTELTVGTYGELGTTVSAKSVNEIFAGFEEQELDDIIIKESLKSSLVNNRTVTLELPPQARWQREQDGAAGSG